jgi:hypothetical protein
MIRFSSLPVDLPKPQTPLRGHTTIRPLKQRYIRTPTIVEKN